MFFVPETKALSLEELDQGLWSCFFFLSSSLTLWIYSVQRANPCARGVPAEGRATQRQEVHLPNEGGPSAAFVRA